jgi:hypothetical protein
LQTELTLAARARLAHHCYLSDEKQALETKVCIEGLSSGTYVSIIHVFRNSKPLLQRVCMIHVHKCWSSSADRRWADRRGKWWCHVIGIELQIVLWGWYLLSRVVAVYRALSGYNNPEISKFRVTLLRTIRTVSEVWPQRVDGQCVGLAVCRTGRAT